MGTELVPQDIRNRFEIEERRHACAILANDFPTEFADLMGCLKQFKLVRSEIVNPGGSKTKIAGRFDDYLYTREWRVKSTAIEMMVDGTPRNVETHSIDLCKGRVACEVQWNSKDGVFSRDLTTFRLLHEWGIISVGIVITRSDELQGIFDKLGWVKDKKGQWQRVASKYGQSTTHWSKLMGRIQGGDSGMCPVLLIGIKKECYVDDMPRTRVVLTKPTE
jgi:Restriction endonuclease BglII